MGGFEPPSKSVIVFALLLLILAATLICSTLIQRLHRSRSTRNLVAILTRRLGSSSSSSSPQHPEARPSKYMKRFAGVSVVDGNAIIDELHYERLREFPQALVEVSEVGTNVDSADFSQSEVATTAASTHSRSGLRFGASRSHTHANREGSLSSEPSRFGKSGCYPDFPALTVEAEEMESADGRRVVNVHSVPPTAHVQEGGGVEDAALYSLMSRHCTATARVSPNNNLGNGLWAVPRRTGSSDALGNRRVITNISVEDLAAHCAALEDEETEEEVGGKAGTSSRSGSSDNNAAGTSAPGEASHHHHDQHNNQHNNNNAKTCEASTTPLTPYAYIMREKVKRARGTHSVVVVDPRTARESSVVDNIDSAELPSSLHESDSLSGDEAGKDLTMQTTRRPRRTVRREHHRHHTSKGGFLVCQDFVPDLASRRVRRRQANVEKPKFVFQMKDDEALYGRSQYLARQPSDDNEDK